MSTNPKNSVTISPSLLREIAQSVQAFDGLKKRVDFGLKSFSFANLIKMRVDEVKQSEALMQPLHEYYVPQTLPYVSETENYTRTVVSLCFDTKYRELYEHENRSHNYVFTKKSDCQFKILQALCNREGFISTKDLAEIGGYKNVGSTYKAIEKINAIGFKIGLPNNLLQSSQGVGFRLNPDFHVSII